jgi:hypothetical protein
VLTDRRLQLLVALALMYGAYLVYRAVKGEFLATDSIPLFIIIPFIASFSVWTIRNYYLTVASVGVAAMVAIVIANLKARHVVPIAALLCLSVAVIWIWWRVPQIYRPLASIQDFLVSTKARHLDKQKELVGVSCMEAPTHFNRYAVANGVPNLNFKWTGDSVEQFRYVLGDERLCPFPVAGAGWQIQWQSPVDGGYSLYRNTQEVT